MTPGSSTSDDDDDDNGNSDGTDDVDGDDDVTLGWVWRSLAEARSWQKPPGGRISSF